MIIKSCKVKNKKKLSLALWGLLYYNDGEINDDDDDLFMIVTMFDGPMHNVTILGTFDPSFVGKCVV